MKNTSEQGVAELFITHVNEMQLLLNDLWLHLRDDCDPEAKQLCQRIENLGIDGAELHHAALKD